MKYFIQTFGCQMNYSDTERVISVLDSLGWERKKELNEVDLVILNTCSVRQKAEDRVAGQIRNISKLRNYNPNLKIGITGCMARDTGIRKKIDTKDPFFIKNQLFNWIKGLDFIFKINDICKLEKIIPRLFPDTKDTDIYGSCKTYFEILPKYGSAVQAYVPIMTGCNNFCSYCIVPYARGREYSRGLEEITDEIKYLVSNGLKEVTLLGQNVNSYKLRSNNKNIRDQIGKKSDFVILLEEVNKIDGIERIRYTSSHPKDFSDDLIEAHSRLKHLCEHVHLAVQSGNNQVLKRMNRHYTGEEFMRKVYNLRESVPGIAITTDIIVGFCGETDEEYNDTLNLVKEIKFDIIYLAKYSPRTGTFANDNYEDDVPYKIKDWRWHKLNNLLETQVQEKNKNFFGKTVEVLVEKSIEGICIGKTRDFKTVHFTGDKDLIGKLVDIKINRTKTWILEGEKTV